MKEALDNGAKVAVCSTSNEKAVTGIRRHHAPRVCRPIQVFAGDVVPKKKPAPDIYNLAAETLGVEPREVRRRGGHSHRTPRGQGGGHARVRDEEHLFGG